jgi:hypothetical protein
VNVRDVAKRWTSKNVASWGRHPLAAIEGAFYGWRLRALMAEADVAHLAVEVTRWMTATRERPGSSSAAVEASVLRRRLRESHQRESELIAAMDRVITKLDGGPWHNSVGNAIDELLIAIGRKPRWPR